jgi:hypothetical protein
MVLQQSARASASASSLDSPASGAAGTHSKLARSLWTRQPAFRRLLFALIFLLSALYMAQHLKRGWVPMDEGLWGKSAELVLEGQLPHRDYHEGYTGGLTYLNALAFRFLGTTSVSMRYALFIFFLAWLPAVYYAGRRFVSPPVASALVFLAVAWGVPNYSGAAPSWYNLFFATFGLAALLRYVEEQRAHWLIVGGMCGGISFLFKQVGMFFIAAALLFLLFREQVANTADSDRGLGSRLYTIFLCLTILLYEAFVFDLILKRLNSVSLLYFFLPAALLGALILWRELTSTPEQGHRFVFLLREVTFFAIGVAIPLAIFLVPFVRGGAIRDLLRDVFILPAKQISSAGWTPSILRFVGGAAANLAVIAGVFLIWPKYRKVAVAVALGGMCGGLLLTRSMASVHKTIWGTLWVVLPTLVISGFVLLLWRAGVDGLSKANSQRLFLILSVCALCSLIQFPFTTGTYFCYVAPLVVLGAAAVISCLNYQPRIFLAGAYCFALIYVVLDVTPGFVYGMGDIYKPDIQVAKLETPRAKGLRVGAMGKRVYEQLGQIIGEHAHGEYIYAAPDCPEMYFLYKFRNPTRFFFDYYDELSGDTRRVMSIIHEHNINLVVLNNDPLFSRPLQPELRTALEHEFPNRAEVGAFQVRWKP